MTEEQLQSIRKRLQAATPEPLVLSQYTHGGGRLWCESPRTLVADFYHEGDREFYGNALEDVQALLEENERLREVERKAQEQSAYIQAHGLTEIEGAALRAENERLRAALEAAKKPKTSNEPRCAYCLSKPAQAGSSWCAECDAELTARDNDL